MTGKVPGRTLSFEETELLFLGGLHEMIVSKLISFVKF
jgi:hypothetical protein